MTINQPQKKPHFISEFLRLVNDAETENERIALMRSICNKSPYDMLLHLAFNPKVKLDLPEGPAPFERDTKTHPDLMSPLVTQINYLKPCIVGYPMPKMKKEKIFLDVCECIPPCDADVLMMCKDKKLDEMFPNITRELVMKVFPQYCGE